MIGHLFSSKDALAFSWFAIRVTYSREMILKTFLDEIGIENFIPMRYENTAGLSSERKLIPSVHNLIFINSSKKQIDEIRLLKSGKLSFSYMIDKATNREIIIPEPQMQSFIKVNTAYEEGVVHLSTSEVCLKKGTRVRVKSGCFKGVEGKYMRIAGDRRVVVEIDNVMAIGTAFVHPTLLEVLE